MALGVIIQVDRRTMFNYMPVERFPGFVHVRKPLVEDKSKRVLCAFRADYD